MAFPPSPGEDSLFSGRNDYVYALGVADGVTDWAGADLAHYPPHTL